MGEPADQFWRTLHERWRGASRQSEMDTVRSVLIHLRRRLPGQELRHLEQRLPDDVRRLWAEPELDARRHGQRPIEKISEYEDFLRLVQREGGLPSAQEAEAATDAVFHALSRFFGDAERTHLAGQLPRGLKERWTAATDRTGSSAA